jgi:hypothetical protein
MPVEEWQQILNLLSEHPFKEVAGPINKIQGQVSQVMAARQTPQPQPSIDVQHALNGSGLQHEETGNA